jgi:hypothetical protein
MTTEERPSRLVIDISAGTETVVPYTDEEWEQSKLDRIAAQEAKAARDVEEARIAELKVSARTKLVAGEPLTEEEAALIVL